MWFLIINRTPWWSLTTSVIDTRYALEVISPDLLLRNSVFIDEFSSKKTHAVSQNPKISAIYLEI